MTNTAVLIPRGGVDFLLVVAFVLCVPIACYVTFRIVAALTWTPSRKARKSHNTRTLEALSRRKNVRIVELLPTNRRIPDHLLRQLAKHDSLRVRFAVAEGRFTSSSILHHMVNDESEDPFIRLVAASNRNLDRDCRLELLQWFRSLDDDTQLRLLSSSAYSEAVGAMLYEGLSPTAWKVLMMRIETEREAARRPAPSPPQPDRFNPGSPGTGVLGGA